MPLLEVVNLEKRFGGIYAANNVNFEVNEREILGLIGPNGAGKSTIMHLIIGLHKPTSGIIKFESKDIQHLSIHERIKRGIAVMFQHSRPLSRQTVLENIKLAILEDKFQLFFKKDIEEQAMQVAKKLGLEHVVHKYPSELPFGTVRKMELAKALALNPKLLLLDEPFAGLSHLEVEEFSKLIRDLKKEDFSIVLVDHNVKAVKNIVDRIVAIHAGKIIACGTPDEVITSLFKAIFNFLNYEGDVKWQGKSIKHLKTADIVNLGIAFVPETRELFKYMSVEENLTIALQKLKKEEIKHRLEEIYSIFPRLSERKKQPASTLSGGEQQMLTIARALVQKPKMIVLDEPTLGLAPVVLEDISKALEYMHRQMNLTILLGEQNLYFALKHSDRVYLLEHGNLICDCTMDEFLERIGEKYLA